MPEYLPNLDLEAHPKLSGEAIRDQALTLHCAVQGPVARLMGLLIALWAWLKERFGSVFTHTSNSSSSAASA